MARSASSTSQDSARGLAGDLLAWYDRHARSLPWRVPPGVKSDPYSVWLSEIMLQQTTVVAVRPYFEAFLTRWPRVEDLAAAPLDEVLSAWAGLGYYARARNLHRCAKVVAGSLCGRFPDSEAALRELPGIGPYTAAAIAAIAFDRPASAVDGNVERVVARLFAVETPLPAAKAELHRLAGGLVPARRTGDYAQAMMDLGATVCLPRGPKCLLCPLAARCLVRGSDLAEALPRRAAKAARPTRRAIAFWAINPSGQILLRRRPERGLLGGMMELPSTEWREAACSEAEAAEQAPFPADWRALPGLVRHTFTHFHLEATIWAGQAKSGLKVPDASWVALDEFGDKALPSVMRKLIRHALAQASSEG